MRSEEVSSPRSEKTDERVLRALLDGLRSLGKSCHGVGRRRIADVLVNHNPRIRVGASLAYLVFDPLLDDEGRNSPPQVLRTYFENEIGLPANGIPRALCALHAH